MLQNIGIEKLGCVHTHETNEPNARKNPFSA